jgi:hypothetical protein
MACRLALALLTVALIPACSSDSARKISDQDCSKPVVLDQGNLRCR